MCVQLIILVIIVNLFIMIPVKLDNMHYKKISNFMFSDFCPIRMMVYAHYLN